MKFSNYTQSLHTAKFPWRELTWTELHLKLCHLSLNCVQSQSDIKSWCRAPAYCRQPTSTVTPGIEPRSFFRCSSFDKKGGIELFFIIGVPLLHHIPPEVMLKSNPVEQSSCRYIASVPTVQKTASVVVEECLRRRCIATVAARAA
jgi:hypothetical protein